MNIIDLRSDCLTLPTAAMRQAMAEAELGDDVFGEDPTINALEALAAEKTGKEAALFVASGTMGNLTALLTHCQRGDEIILGMESHIFLAEGGGAAVLGGIHVRPLPNQPDGTLRPDDIIGAVRSENVHHPRSRLVCIENTHARYGGIPLAPQYMTRVSDLAHEMGLMVHLDGARIFNAAVALGVDVTELTSPVDSLQFCLSKGLSAPVGSVLCGAAAFIQEARRWRKVLGGGMRQAGVLAAAGIVALNTSVDRLVEDHRNARRLAEGLSRISGFSIDPASVQTNIVVWNVVTKRASAEMVMERLGEAGVKVMVIGRGQLRAVTYRGIGTDDIDEAIARADTVMKAVDQEGSHVV